VSLEPYPQVRQWLRRIEALPGFVPMAASPIGLAA
jgi:glutathione S-transferase